MGSPTANICQPLQLGLWNHLFGFLNSHLNSSKILRYPAKVVFGSTAPILPMYPHLSLHPDASWFQSSVYTRNQVTSPRKTWKVKMAASRKVKFWCPMLKLCQLSAQAPVNIASKLATSHTTQPSTSAISEKWWPKICQRVSRKLSNYFETRLAWSRSSAFQSKCQRTSNSELLSEKYTEDHLSNALLHASIQLQGLQWQAAEQGWWWSRHPPQMQWAFLGLDLEMKLGPMMTNDDEWWRMMTNVSSEFKWWDPRCSGGWSTLDSLDMQLVTSNCKRPGSLLTR